MGLKLHYKNPWWPTLSVNAQSVVWQFFKLKRQWNPCFPLTGGHTLFFQVIHHPQGTQENEHSTQDFSSNCYFLICSPKFPFLCNLILSHHDIDNSETSMIRKPLSHILCNLVIFFPSSKFITYNRSLWSQEVTSGSKEETFSRSNISFCFLLYSVLKDV